MGAREKNATQTLILTHTLALCVFLSAPTQGWGQNTSDPFAPNYVAPSEPVATPKAPSPTAPARATQPGTPAAQPAPIKAAPVIEETVTQAPPAPSPAPVTPAPTPTKAAALPAPEEPGIADDGSSFLDKLSNLFSSEEPEEMSAKASPAPKVKEAAIESARRVENLPTPAKVTEPTVTPEPTVQATATKDPFSPASISPAQPTAAPTSPLPIAPSQPARTEEPTTMAENKAQADDPSLLDHLSNIFTDEKKKAEAEPRSRQSVVQKIEQPSTAPEPSPTPRASEPAPEEPGFFERIGEALTSPFSSDEKDVQETLAPQTEENNQPISNIEENTEPAEGSPPTQTEAHELDPRLRTAKLGLGKDILLGQGDNQLSKQAKCFTKNRGTVAFCTTPTRWPAPIARHFQVSTHLYKGVRGILKYDGAIATRLYAIFNSDGFDEVVQYFERQYGPATNTFNRQTRLLTENIDNKSYIWRRPNPDEGLVEVMEIRQFSDMRGPRPDLGHSTIRLYFEGSREIFSMTSDLDFMHLR